MPRLHPRSSTELKPLKKSIAELVKFLELQKTLLPKNEKALKAKYSIESIELSLNQIHAVLRKALWVQAQLHLVSAQRKVMDDEQMFDMLTHPSDMMPKGVADKELYGAAAKFTIITERAAKQLGQLREDAIVTFRDIFEGKSTGQKLPKIASELFKLNTNCVQTFERMVKELKKEIDELQ